MNKLLDALGNWNPQLFRELKGRLTLRNGLVALGVSSAIQILMYLFYLGDLPDFEAVEQYSRYCVGTNDEYFHSVYQCTSDGSSWIINWQLWNFDLFIGLSLLGMAIACVIGAHLIGSDLAKEDKRGTLGFVRLSPQPVSTIMIGKFLGVPSLIYLGLVFALPLHLWVGLQAGIFLGWIVTVYLVTMAAGFSFFSGAALWSLIGGELLGGFQTWLYSSALSLYFFAMSLAGFEENFPANSPVDWLRLFYPGNIFYYLVEQNSLPPSTINYFFPKDLLMTQWYGSTSWLNGMEGFVFMAIHYALLSSIAWQGIRRRFYDPQATIINKQMGYGVAICSTIFLTGFVWIGDRPGRLFSNFETLQVFYFFVILGLSLLLTPTRQRVQDWARFQRHTFFSQAFWRDLAWGDRSPALGAIAIILVLTTGYQMIIALLMPMLDSKSIVIAGLILQMGSLYILAILVQWIFLRHHKRSVWFGSMIGLGSALPVILFLAFNARSTAAIAMGLFSVFPLNAVTMSIPSMVISSIFIQWSLIAGLSWRLKYQIRRLGRSELGASLVPSAE